MEQETAAINVHKTLHGGITTKDHSDFIRQLLAGVPLAGWLAGAPIFEIRDVSRCSQKEALEPAGWLAGWLACQFSNHRRPVRDVSRCSQKEALEPAGWLTGWPGDPILKIQDVTQVSHCRRRGLTHIGHFRDFFFFEHLALSSDTLTVTLAGGRCDVART
jgi:hypothetical protein